jgi:hypothetical protein
VKATSGLKDGNYHQMYAVNFNICNLKKAKSSHYIMKRILTSIEKSANVEIKCPIQEVSYA